MVTLLAECLARALIQRPIAGLHLSQKVLGVRQIECNCRGNWEAYRVRFRTLRVVPCASRHSFDLAITPAIGGYTAVVAREDLKYRDAKYTFPTNAASRLAKYTMAEGAGAGGYVPIPRAQARGRRISQTASLPLDIVLDIAARTDPATLVRCAATCRDLHARVADPGFQRGLRLRHADCFVPSLLRGHLIQEPYQGFYFDKDVEDMQDSNVYLLDAAAGRLRRAAKAFPPGPLARTASP
ncbi:hypothetical protein BS78_04G264700 [Paspalum vaginatum]|nr:hypothetical protein BS78_04G264700 [Paspalum vaginatum]